jgi:hypothetical protein
MSARKMRPSWQHGPAMSSQLRRRAVVLLCALTPGCARLIGAEFDDAYPRDGDASSLTTDGSAEAAVAAPRDADERDVEATRSSDVESEDTAANITETAHDATDAREGASDSSLPIPAHAPSDVADAPLDVSESSIEPDAASDAYEAGVDSGVTLLDAPDAVADGPSNGIDDAESSVSDRADSDLEPETDSVPPDAVDENSEADVQKVPCANVLDLPRGFSSEPAVTSRSQLRGGSLALLSLTVYAAQPNRCLYSNIYDWQFAWGQWYLVQGIESVNSKPAATTFNQIGVGELEAACVRKEPSNQYWCMTGQPGVWSEVPYPTAFRSGPALTSSIDVTGRSSLHLFGISQNDRLMHNVWRDGSWQGWTYAFVTDSTDLVGDPSAATVARPTGELDEVHVCVWRSDLHYGCRELQGSDWELAGVEQYNSSPTAVATGTPRQALHLYGTIANRVSSLWTSERRPDGWTPAEIVPGGSGFRGPTAISWNGVHIHVFTTGLDSAIWYQYWDGSTWFKANTPQGFGDVFTRVPPP